MTKVSVAPNSVEPRAVEADGFEDVSDAQLERAVKILERREAKRLEDERKAAGLRWRYAVLRYVGSTPTTYPSGACTARDFHRPERLRCDGQHLSLPHQEVVFPGELIEQPAGHVDRVPDFVVVEEVQ